MFFHNPIFFSRDFAFNRFLDRLRRAGTGATAATIAEIFLK
jgi:hypothetical protein